MFERLGIGGVFGVFLLLAGIGVVASQNLVVAGGIALVIAGLGFVVYGIVRNLVSALGMMGGGMGGMGGMDDLDDLE
jgi:hypothetical protein